MVAGRDFAEGDESTTVPVAIVNRSLARELWPLGAALDRYMTVNKTRYRVIGVCPDFADDRPGTVPGLQVFLPKAWESRFVVRTRGNSQAEIDRILRIVARVEPRAEATVAAYDTFRARQSASERTYVQFMLSIVIAAMLIAGFGVYAVVIQSVRVNAKQVGIHLAIGAPARCVLAHIVSGLLGWIGWGCVVGGAVGVFAMFSLRPVIRLTQGFEPVAAEICLTATALSILVALSRPLLSIRGIAIAEVLRDE